MADWRRKKRTRIPTKWYGLMPGMGLPFWVRVADAAKKRGVAKKDLDGIRAIALELM